MTNSETRAVTTAVRGGAFVGTPPPFDPECFSGLAAARECFSEPVTYESLLLIRPVLAEADPDNAMLGRVGENQVHERVVPGLEGDPDVPTITLAPVRSTHPTALSYYLHAEGVVFGSRRSDLDLAIENAEAEGIAHLGVKYCSAPKHSDPSPVRDAYAGLVWIVNHAAEFNIDPSRIAIFGFSASGGLASALTMMCRNLGGPALLDRILSEPAFDERNDTVSNFQFQGSGTCIRESNEYGWSALLGDRRRGENVAV